MVLEVPEDESVVAVVVVEVEEGSGVVLLLNGVIDEGLADESVVEDELVEEEP